MSFSTEMTPVSPYRPAPRKRRLPPWWLALLLAPALGGIAVLQFTDVLNDAAFSNVFTWIISFVALMILVAWFIVFSGYSWAVKAVVLGLPVLGLTVFFGLFQFDHFLGNMHPVFVLRPFCASLFGLAPEEKPHLDSNPAAANLVAPATGDDQSKLLVPAGMSRRNNRFRRSREVAAGRPKDADQARGVVSGRSTDFDQFLGPRRNLTVTNVKLARSWPPEGPRQLWKQRIGEGWSAFAVVNGFAVTLEQHDDREVVTCYEVKTGKMWWHWPHPARYETVLAGIGPRSTPTIHNGKVYALGATGKLVCLDGARGKLLWAHDLLDEFGVSLAEEQKRLNFGRANSPLIVDDLVVVPVGGREDKRVSLAAYHKDTGKLVWTGGHRQVSYSSPVLAKLAGVRQILIVNEDTVSGHDPKTGKVLWEFDWPGNSSQDANSSQAIPVAPDCVFTSKGYGLGAALHQLSRAKDGTLTVTEGPLWHNRRVMRTKYTNVAIHEGYVYGLSDGVLECIDLKTGARQWRDGRYGHGQILLVGDLLLVLSEQGELLLVEATPDRSNHVLAQFEALSGTTWNNLALSGPYLLVRNAREAACFELPLQKE